MANVVGTSKSVSGFDPLSIAGCQLWLDANDFSTFTFSSGSNILRWYDKSGYQRNATQRRANATTYSSNSLNSLPTVQFVGQSGADVSTAIQRNMICSVPANTFPTVTTGFVVFARTGADNYTSLISRTPDAGAYGAPFDMWGEQRFTGNGGAYYQWTSSIQIQSRTDPTVFSFQVTATGPTWTEFFNGVPSTITYNNGSTGYSDGGTSVFLGGRGDAVTTFTGNISEVILYSTTLTTAQRQQVEGYLAWKWGMVNLPGYCQLPNPVFSPLSIADCKLWLDAADASKVTVSGTTVTGITDKSPNGTVLTSPAGFTYPNNTFNGRYPSFYNTNTTGGRLGYNSTFTLGGQVTMFIVGQLTSATGFFDFIDGYFSTNRFFLFVSPNNLSAYAFASSASGNQQVTGSVTSAQMTTPFCWSISSDTSTTSGVVQHYLNGIRLAQSSSARFAVTSYTGIVVGQRFNLAAESVVGHISEFIIYNRLLTTAQRQSVENYLMSKWSIASVVPHQFALYPSLTRQFNPVDVPGCQLWLDGNDRSSMTLSGTTITQWNDKSGNGYNATIRSGWSGATVIDHDSNSYGVVYFSSSNVGYETSYPANPTNETVFAVWQNPNANYNNNILIGGQRGARSLGAGYSGSGNGAVANLNSEVVWLASLPAGTYTNSDRVMTTQQFSSTSNGIALNGNFTFTSGGAPGFSNGTTTMLGIDTIQPKVIYYAGYVMELIFYNSVLSTSQRQQVEGYLADKWRLQVKLPGIARAPYDFSITSFRKMILWLDGADQSTMTGTTTLTAWRDKSRLRYTANSFSNSVAAPSWVSNVQNGKGAVQYSAGNGSSITNFNINSTYGAITVFMVYYAINQSTNGPFIELSTDENYNAGFYLHSAGGQNFAYNPGSGQISTNFGNVTVANTWQLIEGNTNDSSQSYKIAFYLNGVLKSSATTGASIPNITSNLYINGRAGTNTLSVNTYLGELIVYDYDLTGGERQSVENYLMNKWGISNITQHAFKGIPPFTAAQFSPLSIAGAQLWMDASADTSADGTTITRIPDLSGKGANLSAIGTITLQRQGRNGLPVYNFGISRASNTGFSWGTSFTHFVVSSSTNGIWLNSVGNLATYVFAGNYDLAYINSNSIFDDLGAATSWTYSTPFAPLPIANNGQYAVLLPGSNTTGTATTVYNVPINANRETSFSFSCPGTAGQYTYFGLNNGSGASGGGLIQFLLLGSSGTPYSIYQFVNGSNLTVAPNQLVRCRVKATTYEIWAGANYSGVVTWTNAGTNNYSLYFTSIGNQSDNYNTQYNYVSFDPGKSFSILPRNTGLASAWNVISVGYTSGSTALTNYSVNGNVRSSWNVSSANATSSVTPSNTLYINGSSTGQYDSTIFGEIIHYNVALTTPQRQAVEGYLAWKWGLTLPTTHPYYRFPPGNVAF